MAEQTLGYGTQLKVGDGQTPENFTAIALVLNIVPPGFSVGVVDRTYHATEKITRAGPGLVTYKQVTMTVQLDPTDPTHDENTGVWKIGINREVKNWQVVLPENLKTYQFAGFIADYTPETPLQDDMKATVVFQPTSNVQIV